MSQKQTVSINGRLYDARTGLPVTASHTTRKELRKQAAPTTAIHPQPKTQQRHTATTKQAQKIHSNVQKSQTLHRKFIKKPASASKPTAALQSTAVPVRKTKHIDTLQPAAKKTILAQSPRIKQIIEPSTPTTTPKSTPTQHTPAQIQHIDATSTTHPVVKRAHTRQTSKKNVAQSLPSAKEIKESTIKQVLDNAPAHHAKQHKQRMSPRRRLAGVVCGCAALILFAGYLTYLNVPNISVRVAAAQAGIDASYPGYHPDGYRLNGPIAFSEGKVQIKFAANTGESNFVLNQSRSTWDSSALLENYVREKSNDEYSVSQEKGLTIYTYEGNAAWVSGGILYTIDGNATLSTDQIHKIATSTS